MAKAVGVCDAYGKTGYGRDVVGVVTKVVGAAAAAARGGTLRR